jgi:hypothetical protein
VPLLNESQGPQRKIFGREGLFLFLASLAMLYFELLVIRYLGTEVRVFAYLKNVPLVASFLGIGIGMTFGRRDRWEKVFPFVAVALFAVIRFSGFLHLTHVGFTDVSYQVFGSLGDGISPILSLFWYLIVTAVILGLVITFFIPLGGFVGEWIKRFEPLRGYGINLAGSLVGILLFSALAFLHTSPAIWLFVGCCALVPFWRAKPVALAALAVILLIHLVPTPGTFWSPYYRIDFHQLPAPNGYDRPSAYYLGVNHDYHQMVVDLSPEFVSRYPNAEPNHLWRPTYEIPYQLSKPSSVLIVGAGTGNDVASALRHGVSHVDAVEIDPLIQQLGKKYHPERPYDSSKVSVHIDDARAFLSKTQAKYDLIVFSSLDSHTVFSSFSSLRLDNYVYTLQSFELARQLLSQDGTMVLIFTGRDFVNERLAATLTKAFGTPPSAFLVGQDGVFSSIVYVEGAGRSQSGLLPYHDVGPTLLRPDTVLATDSWPFLYLAHRTIPESLFVTLLFVILAAHGLLKSSLGEGWTKNPGYLHLFLLGAGFMLLETKAVTELSLLFGSTWIVNAVVIGAFLTMAFLANIAVLVRPISPKLVYALLFASLILGSLVPASVFAGSSVAIKIFAAGGLVALPVFFSGIAFSNSFRFSSRPEKALAVNIFGAMAGGILENAVMLGGVPILGILAILLYAGAAACWFRKEVKNPAPEFQLVPEVAG